MHCSTNPQKRILLEVLQALSRRAKQRIEGRQWRDRIGPVITASNGLLKVEIVNGEKAEKGLGAVAGALCKGVVTMVGLALICTWDLGDARQRQQWLVSAWFFMGWVACDHTDPPWRDWPKKQLAKKERK